MPVETNTNARLASLPEPHSNAGLHRWIQSIKHYAVYVVMRILICGIQMTSLERCDRFCRLGAAALSLLPVRRKLIESNLSSVFPEWDKNTIRQVRWEMWHHLLLMLCEIAHAPRKIHRSNWHHHFRIPDRRSLLEVIFDERAKILVTGHFGNFELAGFVTGLMGIENTTIARPLDNPFVHKFFNDFRSMGGQHFLDKNGSSNAIQDLLDQGGTLALLADQHAGDRGVWTEFLGIPASCHKALALFTLRSNAPMQVVYNRRLGRPLLFELSTLGVADPNSNEDHLGGVRQLTQWYNNALEQIIRQHPDQYWWVHRRWREPPARIQKKQKIAA